MGKIKASGIYSGINVDFIIENSKDGVKVSDADGLESIIKKQVEICLKNERIVIGGTYYPKKDSLLSVYIVLNNYFFDSKDFKIEIIGEIEEIPCEEGVVY